MLNDDQLLLAIEKERHDAPGLSPRQRAMLVYAEKLTLTPHAMAASDAHALKQVGFSDRDILHIVEVIAYYAYVNRIADGLGVTVEADIDSQQD